MKKLLSFMLIIAVPMRVFAADSPADLVGTAMLSAAAQITNDLTSIGTRLLFSLVLLQFIINIFKHFQSGGETDGLTLKAAGSISWAAFCLYTMGEGGSFIQNAANSMLSLASKWAGGDGVSFSTGDVVAAGLTAYGNVSSAVAASVSHSPLQMIAAIAMPELTLITAVLLGLTVLVLLASCAVVAIKVFMVKLELAIVIAISPLSFAFLGLNALRDQGIAPFKYLIAVIYRIIILAAVVSSMGKVSAMMVSVLKANVESGSNDIWTPIFGALFGYVLIAYFAFKSDSIASSLSSGSSNMSSGDVATAAAAGAAAGAALMTGGASLAGAGASGASKVGQTMGDFLKSMSGGNGSISNASGGMGRGGSIGDAPKQTQPGSSPSLASKGGGSSPASNGSTGSSSRGEIPGAASQATGTDSGEVISPGAHLSPGDAASHAATETANAAGASPGAAAVAGRAAGNAADRGATPARAALAGAVAQAAVMAGAAPEAAYAAGNAAATGRGAADIAAAVTGAGGTSAQAAAAGITGAGSGATAGIGGRGSAMQGDLERKVDEIQQALGTERKPTMGNRIAELNDHAAQIDQSAVHASVNAHAD